MHDTPPPGKTRFFDAKIVVVRLVDGRAYRRTLAWGLVGAEEAAGYLGVTPRTIWNFVARGRLHPVRQIRSRRVYFRIGELKALAPPRPPPQQEEQDDGNSHATGT